jgi:hypothetical protein
MEYWNDGLIGKLKIFINPTFQCSTIPFFPIG